MISMCVEINGELNGWTQTQELGINFLAAVRPGNDSVSAAPPEKN